ncbi:MAG: sarcosine oxidase subunit gamma [Sphingomonadaceae bacterium]|nr:sarcosine oxidase subunit gamma [Sphingomonadaceae bacterium]
MVDIALSIAPAGDIVAVDLWNDAVPDFESLHAVRVEPRRWWLIDAGDAADAIAELVHDDGTVTPIGGGLLRATLTGNGWRALLMVGGVFDAEDPGFGPGDCAATVIHHVPVWIVPLDHDVCAVFFAVSYAGGLVELWTAAIARGLA